MSYPAHPLQMLQPEKWKEAEKTWLSWDVFISEKLVLQCKDNSFCLPFLKILCESDPLKYFFYLLIAASLWFSLKELQKRSKIFLLLSIIAMNSLGDIFSNLIKKITIRLRPEQSLESFYATTVKYSFSFPSNHAFNLFALTTALWIFHKRQLSRNSYLHYFCLLLAISVSLGRVLMGRHYPTDVLAGFFLGTLFGASVINLFLHFGERYKLIK
jgi:membrane-associated phospholipid phosphatase